MPEFIRWMVRVISSTLAKMVRCILCPYCAGTTLGMTDIVLTLVYIYIYNIIYIAFLVFQCKMVAVLKYTHGS